MTSKIQMLLEGRGEDEIDYDSIIKEYPWIVEKEINCILSPDSDGITTKKSKNSNVYPNSDNLNLEQLWEKIKKAVEK